MVQQCLAQVPGGKEKQRHIGIWGRACGRGMIRTCERRPQGEKCVTDKQEQRRCSESQIPGDLPLGLLTEVGKEAGKGTVLTCKLFLKASEMKCNYLCGRGGEREVHSFFKDKSYLGDGVESAPVRPLVHAANACKGQGWEANAGPQRGWQEPTT